MFLIMRFLRLFIYKVLNLRQFNEKILYIIVSINTFNNKRIWKKT